MAKHEKFFEKLQSLPTPVNIKWTDLRAALESVVYELITGSGSRRKFFNRRIDALISCHEPHPSPEVGRRCIREIVAHLEMHGLLKGKK